MLKLRNKERGASKIGYLVKKTSADGFKYAGVGDTPIGVVTEVVPSGEICNIQTEGDARVFVGQVVAEGETLRMPLQGEGGNAGVARSAKNDSTYVPIGISTSKGKGLINVVLNISSAGVAAGSSLPDGGATSEVLAKLSAADGDAGWVPQSSGISDAPFSGTATRATLTDPALITYGRYNGNWVDAGLIIDRSGGTGTQVATVGYNERITFVGGGSGMATSYAFASGVHTITLTYTPAGGFYDGWFIVADTGDASSNVVSTALVSFLGDSNITTDMQYATPGGSPPVTADVTFSLNDNISLVSVTTTTGLYSNNLYERTAGSGVTIDGLTIKDGAVVGYYNSSYIDSNFYTQGYINSNFDKYSSWGIKDGVYTRDVISGDRIEFVGGTDIQVQYDGYASGVHALTIDFTGTAGSMDDWYFKVDGGANHTIANHGQVDFQSGTDITATYTFVGGIHGVKFDFTGTSSQWTTSGSDIYYNTGNVGIGTSSVSDKLTISDAALNGIMIKGTSTGDNASSGYLRFQTDVAGRYSGIEGYRDSSSNRMSLRLNTYDGAVVNAMTVNYNGNVGIGKTNPSCALDVVGSIKATGETESYDTSDIRFKELIESMSPEEATHALMQLDTIRYHHKVKKKMELGLLYHQVKEYFPENTKEDLEGMGLVHYGKMIVPMLAMMQSQEKRIQKLEARKWWQLWR